MGDKTICPATEEILKIAKEIGIETAWDRFESQQP